MAGNGDNEDCWHGGKPFDLLSELKLLKRVQRLNFTESIVSFLLARKHGRHFAKLEYCLLYTSDAADE